MTSSIAHIPSGSIPFSQHSEISRPGFGEIQNTSTLTRLIPILTRQADNLARAETQNQVRFTQGNYIVYSSTYEPSSNPNFLLEGGADINTLFTPHQYTTTSDDLDISFKKKFGRDAKVGDAIEFVLNNTTGDTFNVIIGTDITSLSGDTLWYNLVYKTSAGWSFGIVRDRF